MRDRARDVVQPAVLVRRGRLPVRRGRRRSGRRLRVPAESGVRDLARPSGARRGALGAGDGGRARAAAHARRPALAGAGPPGLQGEVLRRSALARRGLPPGHGLGLADRPVRRCLAQAASGRPPGARHLLDGFEQAPDGSVCRVDQRDLRRGTAVHSARLRGAGVERRRSAALPGQDRCASANIRARREDSYQLSAVRSQKDLPDG